MKRQKGSKKYIIAGAILVVICVVAVFVYPLLSGKNKEQVDESAFSTWELSYLPEGYYLVDEVKDEEQNIYTTVYFDKKQQMMEYSQSNLETGADLLKTADGKTVSIGQGEGIIRNSGEESSLILQKGNAVITITGSFAEEELIKMGEGLKGVK